MKLEPFALERYFARHEFNVQYNLCASDCETLSVGELLAMEPGAEADLKALHLGYTETAGDPALRRQIAGLYQGIEAADVLVFAGAEEAIFIFMNAVLQAGDRLLVHSPCYQSLASVAAANNVRVTRWEAGAERGWEPDPVFLEGEAGAAARALVMNFPHNPSGYLPGRDFFQRVLDHAAARDWLVFSDEVYRFLEYEPTHRLPAACEIYENAVSLGVMSKAFGLAGLRLGWVACRNRGLLGAMAAFKDYTTICTAAPSEFLATLALRRRREILARNLGIIRGNLRLLDDFFARHEGHFSWQRPRAGPIAFPAVRFAPASDDFCADLLQKKGVLLLPGRLFGAAPRQFRVGFGRRDFAEGLSEFSDYLRENL
jgi:aspartate/methionine/tyrosine aminotransferase